VGCGPRPAFAHHSSLITVIIALNHIPVARCPWPLLTTIRAPLSFITLYQTLRLKTCLTEHKRSVKVVINNDQYGDYMKSTTVSIAEGKKGFSRLIRDAAQKREEIIVTKRGKPVAVILPYEEYQQSRRLEGYMKVMEAREVFVRSGIRADDVYKETRKQLEKRP